MTLKYVQLIPRITLYNYKHQLCDIAQPSLLRNVKCAVQNQLLILLYKNNCSIGIVFIQESRIQQPSIYRQKMLLI